jgi:hypothetical protein
VNNNPLKYTDPTGHCPACVAVIGGGLTLAGLEIGGGIYGAISSVDQSIPGRLMNGAAEAQRTVESTPGQVALFTSTIGMASFAEGGLNRSDTGTTKIIESSKQLQIKSVISATKTTGSNLKQIVNGNIQWKGNELKVGNNLRIAPYGNPSATLKSGKPNIPARLPHYHLQQVPQNNNISRTSMQWHRPWETLFKNLFK